MSNSYIQFPSSGIIRTNRQNGGHLTLPDFSEYHPFIGQYILSGIIKCILNGCKCDHGYSILRRWYGKSANRQIDTKEPAVVVILLLDFLNLRSDWITNLDVKSFILTAWSHLVGNYSWKNREVGKKLESSIWHGKVRVWNWKVVHFKLFPTAFRTFQVKWRLSN